MIAPANVNVTIRHELVREGTPLCQVPFIHLRDVIPTLESWGLDGMDGGDTIAIASGRLSGHFVRLDNAVVFEVIVHE